MKGAAGVTILLGLISTLIGIGLAILAFEPIPFADAIDFYRVFFAAGGWDGYGFAELYARHNEHRLLVPRLWFLLDLGLFDGTQWFLISVLVLSSAVHAAVLSWLFRGLGHRGALGWAFAALALGAMLSPAQWENLLWGFQVQFVQVWLFATLAFVAAAAPSDGRSWWRAAFAVGCGLASTYSMANGILVWPLLVVVAFRSGLGRGPFRLLLAVAVAVIVTEALGYRPHPGHGDPLQTWTHVADLARYALRYLTSGVGVIGTLGQEILGAALVLVLLGMTIEASARPSRYREGHIVLIAVAAFVVGAALVTALGRLPFGIGQASASRYATPSFVFLVAVSALLLDRLASTSAPRRMTPAAGLGVASVLVLVPGLVTGVLHAPGALADRDARASALFAYSAGSRRPSDMAALYWNAPALALDVLSRLDRAGLGPFADRARYRLPSGVLRAVLQSPADRCIGRADPVAANPGGGFVVTGWAADALSLEQPVWALAIDGTGRPVGWGANRAVRKRTADAAALPHSPRGFVIAGSGPGDDLSSIVGVFADGRWCRIEGGVASPAPTRG